MKNFKVTFKEMFFISWTILFVFEDYLSQIFSPFSYIDEMPIFLFFIYWTINKLNSQKGYIPNRKKIMTFIALSIFVVSGLIGNIVYRYQPIKLVIIDLLTNLKFFGALSFFSLCMDEEILKSKSLSNTVKTLSIVLFLLFLIDRIFNIWPCEMRLGIKAVKLFYSHPTYLAGACVFLISLLATYSAKKNRIFILMDLIMLFFTLRSKAIASALLFVALYVLVKQFHSKLKKWHICIFIVVAIVIALPQIYFYFIKLSGSSARSVMFLTSLQIMKDYFPIGTGFGTYGSHVASASVNYSYVYTKYGFENIYELRNSISGTFFDDQFWPIIFGQTGIIGTICYVYVLYYLFNKIQIIYKINKDCYLGGLFAFTYILIASIAEPAFCNSVSIPLAMVLAIDLNISSYMLKFKKRNLCVVPNLMLKKSLNNCMQYVHVKEDL